MEIFSVFGRIFLKDDGVENKLTGITEKAQETEGSFSGSFEKMKSGALKLGATLLGGLGIKELIQKGYELADSASDLNEAQNVVENTFKSSAKSVEDWTNTTAKSAGISKTASTQWVGFMGAMLKSSGIGENASASMSKNLVQLTGDMSSFYNIGTSDMWEKIRSGISGETMPLKQLGINMDVANLSAYAMSQGITKSYKDMSQAEQTTLRYNYLLSVTKDAQGDFGRTLGDSFANQVRVAELNTKTFEQTLGNMLLPTFMKLVTAFNNNAPKIQKFLNDLGKNSKTIMPMVTAFASVAAAMIPLLNVFKTAENTITSFQKKYKEGTTLIQKSEAKFKSLSSSVKTALSGFKDLTGVQKFENLLGSLGNKAGNTGNILKSKLSVGISGIKSAFINLNSELPGPLSKVNSMIGGEGTKIFGAFKQLGSKMTSGLGSLIKLGLKAIAPAALIATVLMGLGLLQTAMGTKIDAICGQLIIKGPQMIQQFAAKLVAQIPQMIQAGTTLLMSFINVLIANAPALINAATAIITSLVNGLATNLPRLIPEIVQLIQVILQAIVSNLPTIIEAGLKIILALVQGISNNLPQIIQAIVQVTVTIINTLSQHLPEIIELGVAILVAIIEGLARAIPQLIAALPTIVHAIWNGLKNVNWGQLGMAIIQGIGEGLKAAAGGLLDTVKAIGSDIKEGFKSFFGIHSPSTVMRDEVGKYISLGIVEGIKSVDFMQSISDIMDQNSDKPEVAAKKVADLVTQNVQTIKDRLFKETNELNSELNQLNNAEIVALRGVKGNDRYALEDEYNRKKQTIRNEIELRKDQADKDISEIQRVGKMSKEELQQEIQDRKDFASSVNSLVDEIKDALKKKYDEDEQNQEDTINTELDNLDNWKDQAEKIIDDVYSKKEQSIEDAATMQENALQAQIDALDNETAAEDRASKHKEYADKISDLKSQIKYSHDDYNKVELQKQLDQEQSEYQKELNSEAVSDKKDSLQKEIDVIKDNATSQKEQLEKEKQTEINNITTVYNAKKAELSNELTAVKDTYNKETSDAQLEAQAEQMIMKKNQDSIISLLNSYSDAYKLSGQTLGDKLAEGFKPAIDNIKAMIASITDEISSARDSAINTLATTDAIINSASSAPNSLNTTSSTDNRKTIINDIKITSPVAQTPSQQRSDMESTLRKLAFQVS